MAAPKQPRKVNYLNNRDLLKEIHKSKNTFCSYRDKNNDHLYDIIVPNVETIFGDFTDKEKSTTNTILKAKQNRIARIKRETGEVIDIDSIADTDLIFRVVSWDHIPKVPKKLTKAQEKKKSKLEDLLEMDDVNEDDDNIQELMDEVKQDIGYVKLNFPPFVHYRIDDEGKAFLVGKSHWKGDLETGEFCKKHGKMSDKLAHMFIKLCERYATRSNWRGYTYNDEMRGQALLQLSQIGLQFDESKSENPFAYYTATITNSFTRVLNIEKKMQNIRDDILEHNGLNPSWTRQFANSREATQLAEENDATNQNNDE